jgi:SAM-dependent methyltransferase
VSERGMSFGPVAERYDRERAAYPDHLLDDVVAHAGLRPGEAMVEIGAGTGIATRGFAARGLAVHVVEPSHEMAAVLLARAADAGGIQPTAHVTRFEDWQPPQRFGLLAAAQAWHWLDPALRCRRARDALRLGGTIAILGHRLAVADAALRRAIDEARGATGRAMEASAYHSTLPYHPEIAGELAAGGLLDEVEQRTYRFRAAYEPARLLRLLTTVSDHLVAPPEARRRVEETLRQLLRRPGQPSRWTTGPTSTSPERPEPTLVRR